MALLEEPLPLTTVIYQVSLLSLQPLLHLSRGDTSCLLGEEGGGCKTVCHVQRAGPVFRCAPGPYLLGNRASKG